MSADEAPGVALHRLISQRWSPCSVAALWSAVVIGVGLRSRELLWNRSLWRDEASLVFNLRDRGILGFTRPLDHDQATPPGFFVLVQTVGGSLGASETAYRLVPFLASCAALAVGALLARRHLVPVAGITSVSICALSATLVAYGAEVKQYGADLFFTLLVWLALDRAHRRDWSPSATTAFGAVGVLALFSSYPSVFVLPVAGIVAILDARTIPRATRRLLFVGALWVAVLGASYVAWTRELNQSDFLRDFWADGFLPLPPSSPADLGQWADALETLLTQLLAPRAAVALACLAVIGTVHIARRSRPIVILLGAPLLLAIVASSLDLYPVIERSAIFLLPAVAAALGGGTAAIADVAGRRDPYYRWGPVVLVLVLAAAPAVDRALRPPNQEELRPLLEHLAEREERSTVLVTDTAEAAWVYYADRLGLDPAQVLVRDFRRDDPEAAYDIADELHGRGDVWVVDVAFWRPAGALDPALHDALASAGRLIDARHDTGASVYHYDLSP